MTPYNFSYACFDCRKSFKRSLGKAKPNEYPKTMVCPNCQGVARCLYRHFKSPRQSDSRQWRKIEFLYEHGFRFQKIRPNGPGGASVPYPETLEDAQEFVVLYAKFARFDI